MSELKNELYKQCLDYVQKCMEAAQLAIAEADKSSKDDTKSSAGDKYETGREMMQQETNRNIAQLVEANKLKISLNKINPNVVINEVGAGSAVITGNGNFYIAISAGLLKVNNESYYAISPASPVGIGLTGKKAGDEFKLNDKIYLVLKVF